MKKFAIFLALIVGSISVLFAGCGGSNVIRVNEVTHSIFYAPFYAAINLGYMEEEGIEIDLTNGGGSDQSMTALLSGSADMALLGPETAVYVVGEGAKNAPVIVGQLTKRDGSLLVGRTNETNFNWSNLAGKEIIGGRRGGSPAMSLQYAVEKAGNTVGTAPEQCNINLDVAFNLVVGAFEAGQGDYCTMFEPTASEYVAAGKGYIVAAVGQASGEVPFTCFMAMQSYLNKNQSKVEGFLRAVSRAYNYLISATDQEIIDALKPSFSTTTDEIIVSAVRNYIDFDMWKSTPVMNKADFERLQDVMQNAGELQKRINFEDVVNNTYAEKVIDSLK
ncbi:MAG: ABC transporter substrate-binding protein [Firmicutes bacterium]|nr:ABC transporter substrate-binding protein [Bacillota bacterium]MDY5585928.1 ABC transporter substrate-binding protein [Eubacteriales bacterium]